MPRTHTVSYQCAKSSCGHNLLAIWFCLRVSLARALALTHMALTFDIPIDKHSMRNQPYFIRKWFENRNPFQNCDWIESHRCERGRGVRAHSTRYIYEWWEPILAACEIEQMFPSERAAFIIVIINYLSIACVMFCCVALAVVTRCSKINEIPEAVAHLTCGIRLSSQTNHSAHYRQHKR